jgi:hypothetical protein
VAEYQILYWHDIPLQVRSGDRRDRVSQELPPRFQLAIDKAAMAADLAGTDQYLSEFYWNERQEREGSPAEVVTAVVAELDARYPVVDWEQTVHSIMQGRRSTVS